MASWNEPKAFSEHRRPFHTSGLSPTTDMLLGLMDGNEPSNDDVRPGILQRSPNPDKERGSGRCTDSVKGSIETGLILEECSSPPPLSSNGSPSGYRKGEVQRNRCLAVDLGFSDDSSSFWTQTKRVLRNIWSSLKMIHLFLSLVWTDVKTRTCSYCLGFFSVMVVVLLCVLMISLLANASILFLRLSEAERGEYDLRIGPGGFVSSATTINYTMIQELFPHSNATYGLHAPRMLDVFNARKVSTCPGKNASALWYSLAGDLCSGEDVCMDECSAVEWATVNLVAIDTAAERRMGFGSQYNQPTPGPGELILSHSAALLMGGVRVGDFVALYGDGRPRMQEAFSTFSGKGTTDVIMVFTVIAVMDTDDRKFPDLKSFVVVSFQSYLQDLAKGLSPATTPENVAAVAATSPMDCASFVYFIMDPLTRLRAYRSTNYNTIRRNIVAWSSGILYPLGFLQTSRQTPQLSGLWSTRSISVFLGLLISVILLALAFLSVVLIYTLLTVGIETKTYELGIQRMVGFTRENLVVLVLTNAYSFTLPAWVLGLSIGQGAYTAVRQLFVSMIAVTLPVGVTRASIGWATLAGLGIPIIASLFPIMALVTQKLPDALNTSRGRSIGVVFKIHRNDSSGLNGAMFGLGILLFVFGFLIYYLFPTGLIAMNLSLIFYIFFAVLIGLLAGFVLLALNFERVCQVSVSYLLLFWESKAVFSFMQKSLSAHRQRNRKTTLMYSLSLALVIFITVAVQIELTAFKYAARQQMGCEVLVTTGSLKMRDYWQVEEYLDTYIAAGLITRYTYEFQSTALEGTSDQKLKSLGRYRSSTASVNPLPPNYFDVLDSDFLLVSAVDPLVKQYGLLQSLYTEAGMRSGIMSSGAASFLGVGHAEGVLIYAAGQLVNATAGTHKGFLSPARPVASMYLAPANIMSKFSSDFTPWLMAIPSHFRQINDSYSSVLGGVVPHIRLRANNAGDYKEIGDSMTSILTSMGYKASISTITEKLAETAMTSRMLNILFILAELMILVICFFSLMSSMTTNVLNSSKEIGVLLCMGMTRFQVYRVYIWEAFILVVSSGLVGFVVGMIVAYTMLLQQILFAQISFPFPFPYIQLCIVVAVGFVSALASSISPVAYLLGLPSVTHILRRSTT